jgi:hypothetical protein
MIETPDDQPDLPEHRERAFDLRRQPLAPRIAQGEIELHPGKPTLQPSPSREPSARQRSGKSLAVA